MKKLLLISSLLLVTILANAQVYEIEQEQICWNTPTGIDSSLNRYILLSNLDNQPPRILGYYNAQLQSVDVTVGGTLGLCCCIDYPYYNIDLALDSVLVLSQNGVPIDSVTLQFPDLPICYDTVAISGFTPQLFQPLHRNGSTLTPADTANVASFVITDIVSPTEVVVCHEGFYETILPDGLYYTPASAGAATTTSYTDNRQFLYEVYNGYLYADVGDIVLQSEEEEEEIQLSCRDTVTISGFTPALLQPLHRNGSVLSVADTANVASFVITEIISPTEVVICHEGSYETALPDGIYYTPASAGNAVTTSYSSNRQFLYEVYSGTAYVDVGDIVLQTEDEEEEEEIQLSCRDTITISGFTPALLQPIHRNGSVLSVADTANIASFVITEIISPTEVVICHEGFYSTTLPDGLYYTPATTGNAVTTAYDNNRQFLYEVFSGYAYVDVQDLVLQAEEEEGGLADVIASNGLNDFNPHPDSVDVELGGPLERNTVVTGGGIFNLDWKDLNNWFQSALRNMTVSGQYTTITGDTLNLEADEQLWIKTPSVQDGIATNLQVLTLIDENTGLAEFADNVDSDDQRLSYNPATNELTIEDGNTVDLSLVQVIPRLARIALASPQTINNVGAPWNNLNLGVVTFDEILGTTGTGYTVPDDGTYKITLVLNLFDNNSQRVAHRKRILVNGALPAGYSVFEGSNYMRDASAHDSAGDTYTDVYQLTAGDVITFQAQTNSVQTNTTTLLGSWVIIERTR